MVLASVVHLFASGMTASGIKTGPSNLLLELAKDLNHIKKEGQKIEGWSVESFEHGMDQIMGFAQKHKYHQTYSSSRGTAEFVVNGAEIVFYCDLVLDADPEIAQLIFSEPQAFPSIMSSFQIRPVDDCCDHDNFYFTNHLKVLSPVPFLLDDREAFIHTKLFNLTPTDTLWTTQSTDSFSKNRKAPKHQLVYERPCSAIPAKLDKNSTLMNLYFGAISAKSCPGKPGMTRFRVLVHYDQTISVPAWIISWMASSFADTAIDELVAMIHETKECRGRSTDSSSCQFIWKDPHVRRRLKAYRKKHSKKANVAKKALGV